MKRLIALALLLCCGVVQAALIDRGGGFIYDDVLDVSWLQDANLAGTMGMGTNGRMNWYEADAWVESLSIYDSVRDVTWDDWRLPNLDKNNDNTHKNCGNSTEVECRDNELGYMRHYYGIRDHAPGVFSNVRGTYWSSNLCPTCAAPNEAWVFHFDEAYGAHLSVEDMEFSTNSVWAVRDGDVAANVIPIPAAVWLFGSALVGLGWFKRRAA